MDYQLVKTDHKVQALKNRLEQLEGLHYSNEVYLLEARALGETARVAQLNGEQDALETMIEAVRKERSKLGITEPVDNTE